VTCLIGFDFEAFKAASAKDDPEAAFREAAQAKLSELTPQLAKSFKDVAPRKIELFFFPVPSVSDFRNLFQSKIGWINKSAES
jgi:hypothetical protein